MFSAVVWLNPRVKHLALLAHRRISAAAAGDGSGLLPFHQLRTSCALTVGTALIFLFYSSLLFLILDYTY